MSSLNYWRLPLVSVIAGEYPGSADLNTARAKLTELLSLGVTTIIDLTEPGEGLRDYNTLLRTLPGGRFLHHLRLPIPDADVTDPATLHRILDHIGVALADGGVVYLHCWGGIGRTGMIAGCALVRRGLPPSGALHVVENGWRSTPKAQLAKHVERTSPETVDQMRVVAKWEDEEIARATARGQTRLRVYDLGAPPLPKALLPVNPLDAGRKSRARGCLLGGAVGDALGWPVEFKSLEEIRRIYGPDGIAELQVNPRTGVAEITDDTQMTLFTTEGLIYGRRDINNRGFGRLWSEIYISYRRWLLTQEGFAQFQVDGAHEAGLLLGCHFPDLAQFRTLTPQALASLPGGKWKSRLLGDPAMHVRRAPGTTCLSALRSHRSGTLGTPAVNDSKGCGGVMRVAPIGLLMPDMGIKGVFELACQVAGYTHGHPTGQLSAGVFAVMVWCLNQNSTIEQAVAEARAMLKKKPGRQETAAAITRAVRVAKSGQPSSAATLATLGQGWVAEEALAMAIFCALRGEDDDFASALRLAVNHDGDSDSTGSMTGQLLGTRFGVEGIPERWLKVVELGGVIAEMADEVVTE